MHVRFACIILHTVKCLPTRYNFCTVFEYKCVCCSDYVVISNLYIILVVLICVGYIMWASSPFPKIHSGI